MDLQERDLRQRDLVPPTQLAGCRATVVGVGAVGRQVALQLAALGVPWLQLIDFDSVEVVNLAPQGYLEEDLGRPKVEATAEMCRRINSRTALHPVQDRFRRHTETGNVVFACVDSIAVRRLLWQSIRGRAALFVDGRMAAEVLRVLAVCDGASGEHYDGTLFAADEAYAGSCTARSTIFTAGILAGLMLSRLARWLRRLPVEPDMSLNLLTDELSVGVT